MITEAWCTGREVLPGATVAFLPTIEILSETTVARVQHILADDNGLHKSTLTVHEMVFIAMYMC